MASKDVVIFEQSVDFLAKYYYGKKLSSNINVYKLPKVSNEVTSGSHDSHHVFILGLLSNGARVFTK